MNLNSITAQECMIQGRNEDGLPTMMMIESHVIIKPLSQATNLFAIKL